MKNKNWIRILFVMSGSILVLSGIFLLILVDTAKVTMLGVCVWQGDTICYADSGATMEFTSGASTAPSPEVIDNFAKYGSTTPPPTTTLPPATTQPPTIIPPPTTQPPTITPPSTIIVTTPEESFTPDSFTPIIQKDNKTLIQYTTPPNQKTIYKISMVFMVVGIAIISVGVVMSPKQYKKGRR